ncbi:MAG: hypothetical protein ACRC6A_08045 [Fusobacteriaceae bacterium]
MKKFKVAIIGPQSSGLRIEKIILKKELNLIAKIYPVEKIQNAYKVMEMAEKECQGFIFTGIGVYTRINEQYPILKPYIYIPYLSGSITKALWEMKIKYPQNKIISIDTIKKEHLDDVLEELNIQDLEYHFIEYNFKKTEESILSSHLALNHKYNNIVSIVGFSWVYHELIKQKKQCIRLYATNSDILDKIKELEHQLKVITEKEAKISVQILEIIGKDKNERSYNSLEINSKVENLIIPYLREIKGAIYNSGYNQFIIFSTLGAINSDGNIYLLKKVLDELNKNKIKISVGNGIGQTVLESEINARKALELSKRYENNCIFQINNGKVTGPILENINLQYTLYIDDLKLKEISDFTNISIIHLKKIKFVMLKENKIDFNSEELAHYLNITTRSTNRIIKKLVDNSLAKEKESTMCSGPGRPKKQIEFLF